MICRHRTLCLLLVALAISVAVGARWDGNRTADGTWISPDASSGHFWDDGVDATQGRFQHANHRQSDFTDEVMIDKSFPVRPGERLLIDNAHSDVFIRTGSGSEARVRVVLTGNVSDRTRAFYEHLNFEVEKSGNTIEVTTNPRGNFRGSSGRGSIDIFVEVPSTFNADVSTRHGDVEVGDLKGELEFDIQHGDLDAGQFSGSSFRLSAQHGDVEIEGVATEKSLFRIQHGDLAIRELTGMEVQIDMQHGDVHLRDLTATGLKADLQHSDIEIERLDARPEITVSHGSIEVNLANARGGYFSTDHGDIDLEAATSSGLNISFSGRDLVGDSDFRCDGIRDRRSLEGSINGGGPELVARSSHGHVRLHAR